jgi:flagellar motility protein MotE (MotC chaperone)
MRGPPRASRRRLPRPRLVLPLLIGLAGLLLAVKLLPLAAGLPPAHAEAPEAPEAAQAAEAAPRWLAPEGALPVPEALAEELADWQRRLERREADLLAREESLSALEARMADEVARLEGLGAELRALLGEIEEEEEVRLQSLARMYEAMRPKEAARIFDRLEMPVLLQLVRRMREVRSAPILANMDTRRAEQLTRELAREIERHRGAGS